MNLNQNRTEQTIRILILSYLSNPKLNQQQAHLSKSIKAKTVTDGY